MYQPLSPDAEHTQQDEELGIELAPPSAELQAYPTGEGSSSGDGSVDLEAQGGGVEGAGVQTISSSTSVAHYVPTGVEYVQYLETKNYELDLRESLRVAWEFYKLNWLNLTGSLVVLLLVVAVSRVFGAFVLWFMLNGYMLMIANALRGGNDAIRETRFGDIFGAWPFFFPLLAITAAMFVVFLITFSPTIYLLEETKLAWFWDFLIFSLCVLVFFGLLALIVFAPMILMEHYRDGRPGAAPLTRAGARSANEPSELPTTCGHGVLSAFSCSFLQARKQYVAVVTYLMGCFSLALSGLFLFGIGVLITFPVGCVLFVIMFVEMFGLRESDALPGNCVFCACR